MVEDVHEHVHEGRAPPHEHVYFKWHMQEEIPSRKAQQGVHEINFADRGHLDSRRGS